MRLVTPHANNIRLTFKLLKLLALRIRPLLDGYLMATIEVELSNTTSTHSASMPPTFTPAPQLFDDDVRLAARGPLGGAVEGVGVDRGGDAEVLALGVDADDRAAAADRGALGDEEGEVDLAAGFEGVVGLEVDADAADVAGGAFATAELDRQLHRKAFGSASFVRHCLGADHTPAIRAEG